MKTKIGNIIVGQSGGPTAAINSSLAGVYQTAKELGASKIYGMLHGIEGLLKDDYIDLSDYLRTDLDIELLKRTPSSFLRSCRYRLPSVGKDEDTYRKIFALLKKLDIQIFLYIGGNDSMDSIQKLSEYAKRIGSNIRFMGSPKTIDNDLAETDHTPGFGSAAKYIGTALKEIITDAHVYDMNFITIVEIMGRNAGWLTAASALSRMEDCPGPDLMYLPEIAFDVEAFLAKTREYRKTKKSFVVAVSEGLKTKEGKYVCELGASDSKSLDAFGHAQLSGTANYLSALCAKEFKCKTRVIEFSTLQRCASHIASHTDITEAFQAGGFALKMAAEGHNAQMVIINRLSNEPYAVNFIAKDIDKIANIEKKFPIEWLTHDRDLVKKEFLTYCRPLIQGELTPMMVNGLPRHKYLRI
ncbi:MAG: 6-phosphofructokinase [Firmicutes bacterium]|nr:6-phosphofructokinase [Bacillota bacterium]